MDHALTEFRRAAARENRGRHGLQRRYSPTLRAQAVARPVMELKGFERVSLAPGQSADVTFRLSPDELRSWIGT